MSTLQIIDNEKLMLTKGATDELLKKCSSILVDGMFFTPKRLLLFHKTHYV